MRHQIGGRKLGRMQGPRLALYRNLIVSVLRYEKVMTTEAKAKEIRPQVERMITLAKRGDLAARRTVVAEALASRRPAFNGAVAPAKGLCLRRVVMGRVAREMNGDT